MLNNLNADDVEFGQIDYGYGKITTVMTMKSTGETLTLSGDWWHTVERFCFADGDLYWWQIDDMCNTDVVEPAGQVISGTDADDNIYGGDGGDTIYGGAGNDSIYGDELAGDYLYRQGGDTIYGGAGDDTIYGLIGNNVLYGDEGNDVLYNYSDVGSFCPGDNTLCGGEGDDIYALMWTAGNVVIREDSGNDTIQIGNTSNFYEPIWDQPDLYRDYILSKLTVNAVGNDLLIENIATGESLRIENWFSGDNYKIEHFNFASMFELTAAEIEAMATGSWSVGTENADEIYATGNEAAVDGKAGDDTMYGGTGNDVLYGGDGNDSISGGAGDDRLYGGDGNDTLLGGAGSDTYGFYRGAGNDIVTETGISGDADTIRFNDIASKDELDVARDGDNLIISITDTGDTLTLTNWFTQDGTNNYKIEQFELSNGTILSAAEIEAMIQVLPTLPTISGTDGDDVLYGTASAEIIDAGSGNDYLSGAAGNDSLLGGADNDYLNGSTGDDTLDGGTGNDSLYGGAGNDTYIWTTGMGNDIVNESNSASTNDTINFGALKSTDVSFVYLPLQR